MKRKIYFIGLLIAFSGMWILNGCKVDVPMDYLSKDIEYGIGTWNADSLGNHRTVLSVIEDAKVVWAHIEWRRRDTLADKTDIIVIDAKTGERIRNVARANVNREYADILFEPRTVPGEYYVYYLPYRLKGSVNYPNGVYQSPDSTLADAKWLKKFKLSALNLQNKQLNIYTKAFVKRFESIDKFNSFYPMEVIATKAETQRLLDQNNNASYLLFPELRQFPIRMKYDLPKRWVDKEVTRTLEDTVTRGEYYTFQIGVYAVTDSIRDLDVKFGNLSNGISEVKASEFTCFNKGGINAKGDVFEKLVTVEKRAVRALWCGVQIPKSIETGSFEGEVTILPYGMEPQTVKLTLTVGSRIVDDAGVSNPASLSRLKWLNSQLAMDDGIVAPYTALQHDTTGISCLGRKVKLDELGFPQSIKSYFDIEMTKLTETPREILTKEIKLIIEKYDFSPDMWKNVSIDFIKDNSGVVAWEAKNKSDLFTMELKGKMEFDGCMEYEITLIANKDTEVNDIRLQIPMSKDVAKYMMGLGFKGGLRPERFDWTWDVAKNQDAVWVGDVNAGIQASFYDENYERPLNTNFYRLKPLNLPTSWYNGGKGTCKVTDRSDGCVITASSGNRKLLRGQMLHYNFRLLITPFRTLDTDKQWNTRFFHAYEPVDEIASTGANVVNVHHGNEVNPYINYPFLSEPKMKEYIDEAHSRGLRVKLYYTVRELTYRAPEIDALLSLDNEVISHGKGGGYAWLQEHLNNNYIAGWFVPEWKDAALINSGVSRWHNFYIEGLDYLVDNMKIDGIYIDDVAFDRKTMKRVRKVLERSNKAALIDLHSANQYNERDGFASSANLYMEHFPYIDRLWFGEYFDYNSAPEYWMTEISGIPFGLMGEMLQDNGNPWRGMLYGMTNRLPWAGDPRQLWKVWNDFKIKDSRMIGYWVPYNPVKTNVSSVLTTTFVNQKDKKALVAIASWSAKKEKVKLTFNWDSLKIDPRKAIIKATAISDFQPAATFLPTDEIPIEAGKGWLLLIMEKKEE